MEKSLTAVNAEDDYQAIRKAIDALNQGTMRLAELMMDTAVSSALKGKNMEEADLAKARPHRIPWQKQSSNSSAASRRLSREHLTLGKRLRTNLRSIWQTKKLKAAEQPQDAPSENTVQVTFLPEGKTVQFEHGKMPYENHGKEQSLLDVALNFGITLDHACGGNCACTTCHIWVKEGPRTYRRWTTTRRTG